MQLTFESTIIYWRGPSPFFYAPVPESHVADIRRAAKLVSYGWGMIPVEATIGGVSFVTSLFPKDDTYLLPIKAAVRKQTGVTVDDVIAVQMEIKGR